MTLQARVTQAFERVAQEINDIRGELPDTTESPIATKNDSVSITQGLNGAFADKLLALAGDAGKTTFYVQLISPSGGPCSIACEEDGLLFINDAFVRRMRAQEIYQYNAQVGDKLQMRGGGMNAVNRASNTQDTPIEVNNTSNAATELLWNRFREASGDEATTATLPIETNIKVYGPNPTFVNGVVTGAPQHDIDIPAGGTVAYVTVGTGEYYLKASQPIIHSTSNRHSSGAADPRAVNPPTFQSMGHTRSGGGNNLSSLRPGNTSTVYQRSGEIGVFSPSPGSPAKIDVGIGGNADHDPNDVAFIDSGGETSGYAGADAGGRNATQYQDIRAASNNFVLALNMDQVAQNDDRGSLFGQFECEWFVFDPDGSFRGVIEMRRGTGGAAASPATTKEHQLHPAAVTFQPNQGIFSGLSSIPQGTRFIGNMRGFLTANYSHAPDNFALEDETTVFGTVLPQYLCQTRKLQNGLGERLVLDQATGVSTWQPW